MSAPEPEAGSPEPEAGSSEPEAGSPEPEAGARDQETGSPRREAGSPQQAGSPERGAGSAPTTRPWWWYAPFVLLALVYVAHFAVILTHAVDVPFRDEWELLRPDALPGGLRWSWLFEQENEHRMPWLRLEVWALYHLNGWHLPTQQALNFLLYGGLVALVAAHTVRLGLSPWAAAWFALPLLSPIAWENHGIGWQVIWHLAVLGSVLMAWGLFDPRPGWRPRALGVAGLVLAVYAFTTGVVIALTVLVAWLLTRADGASPQGRRELSLVAGVGLLCVATWAWGWHRVGESDPTLPWQPAFWDFTLNLLAAGFGFETLSAGLGALCLALIAGPGLALALRRGREAPWAALALLLGIGAALASIAFGRALWTARYAKTSRYIGLALFVLPYTAVLWQALWREHPRRARAALVGVWLVAALGLADDWTAADYRDLAAVKREGLALTQAYRRGEAQPPVRLPTFFHGRDLAPLIDEAYGLELSFTRAAAAGR